jgi:NAD(P)-dependent dehydrogenase (short-subunit alcohol dehydrogenase family)
VATTEPVTGVQGEGVSGSKRRLEGRAALIIGASRGIGAATAQAFSREGARLVLAARDQQRMDELAEPLRAAGGEVLVVKLDVTEPGAIAAAVEGCVKHYGRLDVAVNNAAVSNVHIEFHEQTEEMFDRVIGTNLRSVFVGMKYQIRAMLATGGGSIVNTASIGGMVAFPKMAAYVASKHGVLGLTKSAALEYASQGIRINAVAPGAVLTEMLLAGTASTEAGRQGIIGATPMRRIAAPEEVAAAIVWLASDEASFVTGVSLPVDGGYMLP